MKAQSPNSRRAQRRANRTFKGSRCNRRMERRSLFSMASYENGKKADKTNGGRSYVKPGSQKRW